MYLSEEKRAEIRECIGKDQSNSGLDSEINLGKNKINHTQGFHIQRGGRKVSQILFDARDGREVFTPF
jgi:hypothetical protein